jgi:hypothetical protein
VIELSSMYSPVLALVAVEAQPVPSEPRLRPAVRRTARPWIFLRI